MAAARRSPPLVLNGLVEVDTLIGEPGRDWTLIMCSKQKAYGCGEHGQEVVEGLKLYMHLGDSPDLTSSMVICVSDKALRAVDLEFGGRSQERHPRLEIHRGGIINIVDQNLMVLTLAFRRSLPLELFYHLVYDVSDASLSLFKYLPDHHKVVCGPKPVLERTSDGRAYELILMAHNTRVPEVDTDIYPLDVLCVCSPETMDFATGPCLIKERRFPWMVPNLFSADVVFSFKGKAFWADLSQGVVYCDLHTSGSVVDLDFINLPTGCQLDPEAMLKDDYPIKMTRTMGCVGDSIWFVCVERTRSYANDTVTMWTLDLPDKEWREEEKVSIKVLWGLDSFEEAGLPEAPFECPVLTPDGALSLLLCDQCEFNECALPDDCICGFDMCLKNLLWHGLVINFAGTEPIILPSNFLSMLRKRKWTEHLPAEGGH